MFFSFKQRQVKVTVEFKGLGTCKAHLTFSGMSSCWLLSFHWASPEAKLRTNDVRHAFETLPNYRKHLWLPSENRYVVQIDSPRCLLSVLSAMIHIGRSCGVTMDNVRILEAEAREP